MILLCPNFLIKLPVTSEGKNIAAICSWITSPVLVKLIFSITCILIGVAVIKNDITAYANADATKACRNLG